MNVIAVKSSQRNDVVQHISIQSYECFQCQETFLKKSKFVRHMTVHTREKTYQCS